VILHGKDLGASESFNIRGGKQGMFASFDIHLDAIDGGQAALIQKGSQGQSGYANTFNGTVFTDYIATVRTFSRRCIKPDIPIVVTDCHLKATNATLQSVPAYMLKKDIVGFRKRLDRINRRLRTPDRGPQSKRSNIGTKVHYGFALAGDQVFIGKPNMPYRG
jgi:hypothetical protein